MRADRGSLGDPTPNTDRQRGGSYELPTPWLAPIPSCGLRGPGSHISPVRPGWLPLPYLKTFRDKGDCAGEGALSLGPLYCTLGIRNLGS